MSHIKVTLRHPDMGDDVVLNLAADGEFVVEGSRLYNPKTDETFTVIQVDEDVLPPPPYTDDPAYES